MAIQSPFIIYNASAGSGKTFTLVKAYLAILFNSNQKHAFKNILALTFTNKAVAEMKERVIDMLIEFSNPSILTDPHPMFGLLANELNLEAHELHKRSRHILNTIAHNYAAFDISTIDKFNHRLIRTFAHDLKLPLNFEVELDTKTILAKAVDQLIDQAGSDSALTKTLVDFAIEKADDDKSWDVAFDFNQIANLLISEADIPFIDSLKTKTADDFKNLKRGLQQDLKSLESYIVSQSQDALNLMENNGLEHSDFLRSSLPKYFIKFTEKNFDVKFESDWHKNIDDTPFYTKKLPPYKADIIDRLRPELVDIFKETKKTIFKIKFIRNVLKNITPLSVLNAIHKSLEDIKREEDVLLISEFNNLISKEIKTQPAPFIYERIGEKFNHYFIDEFQDTSTKQWENLIPLVNNAISGQNLKGQIGTAMLVGDAKQAIYRWRGGKAEQFIDLYSGVQQPFHTKQMVENLPANYRSLETIVNFNNNFFKHISTFLFSHSAHQEIYGACGQVHSIEGQGFVELSFLEFEKEEQHLAYGQKVFDTIDKAKNDGFEFRDICIITRKKDEGIALAEFLSVENIPIISSESLLIKNSPEVQFLSNIIALAGQPHNDMLKIEVLEYLADYRLQLHDKHLFFAELVHLEVFDLFRELSRYQLYFDFNEFLQLPFYEAVESLVRKFSLNKTSNAYIQFFLDEVLDYSQKYNAGFSNFSSHWDIKKKSLSITSPQGNNAVQIMTIHKSKGLEFPVVIFPYANQKIYYDKQPKMWFPVDSETFHGFSDVFINVNKDLEELGTLGQTLYSEYRAHLELDSLNLLYVVLTRAVEQLYIVSAYDTDKGAKEKLDSYSSLFINYLKSAQLWNDSERTYALGASKRVLTGKKVEESSIQKEFISVAKEDHDLRIVTNAGYLWDTEQEAAIEKGNLVHLIMSKIETAHDVDSVLEDFENNGAISALQSMELKFIISKIVDHVTLKNFFQPDMKVYNEKDIIVSDGRILRPDRIVINNQREVAIIDYKTGFENQSHERQINQYKNILNDMGFKVTHKILVYINEDIQIKEF